MWAFEQLWPMVDVVWARKIIWCMLGEKKMIDMNMKDYVDPIQLGLKMNTRVISGQVVQTVKSSRYNVVLLLMKHPYFTQLRFNTFDKTVYWNGKALDDNQLAE